MKRTFTLAVPILVAAAALFPDVAMACQVCFGDPDSPMTKGAQAGVWVLLGIVVAVEAAFGAFFFVYLRRRTRYFPDGSLKPRLKIVKE